MTANFFALRDWPGEFLFVTDPLSFSSVSSVASEVGAKAPAGSRLRRQHTAEKFGRRAHRGLGPRDGDGHPPRAAPVGRSPPTRQRRTPTDHQPAGGARPDNIAQMPRKAPRGTRSVVRHVAVWFDMRLSVVYGDFHRQPVELLTRVANSGKRARRCWRRACRDRRRKGRR